MEKKLLSGDEAIARGAFEHGVTVAAAYPGTPSTEILENMVQYPDIYSQWSPNEKTAFEVGVGSSIAGARTLVAMKHVGVNVAADPLMTFAYTGVSGGFVLVSADDPGMHSSQNEQDNRQYGAFARIPVLEPSDSQECKDFVGEALEISERFDTPVILRITTRTAHAKSVVALSSRREHPLKGGGAIPRSKYVMLPHFARGRRVAVAQREKDLRVFSDQAGLNRCEPGDGDVGVITSGISYQYVKELLPGAPVLKLGMTWPLPEQKIRAFASSVRRTLVVEELDPYLENQIKAMGLAVEGKSLFPETGEFSPEVVRRGLVSGGVLQPIASGCRQVPGDLLTPRPPSMCSGCPHLGVFLALGKLKDAVVCGDIGCYTLGALPPVGVMDTCICMGASITVALGYAKARGSGKGVVAVIGDSTFLHSGLTGLLDAVYNGSDITVLISDNRITAMTGGQQHASTGLTLMGKQAPDPDLATICRSLGARHVFQADPTDHKSFLKLLKEESQSEHLSVIITDRPCVLYPKKVVRPKYAVFPDVCIGCGACRKSACPALTPSSDKTAKGHAKTSLDPGLCTGCSLCCSVCPTGAIRPLNEGGVK